MDSDHKHRRLDLRIVHYDEYACGILYFTGSDEFNKQMRKEALKKGFTLNDYWLKKLGSNGILVNWQNKCVNFSINFSNVIRFASRRTIGSDLWKGCVWSFGHGI